MTQDIDIAEVDVAIVGYGPTGLAAASALGRLGHQVLVCERWPALYGLPRLTHIDGETARAIQAVADVDTALRDSTPTEYTWVNGNGQVLVHIPARPAGAMGFPEDISIYQPDIEDAIDDRVRSYPDVEVRQGWALTDLVQDDEGVTLSLGRWDSTTRTAAACSRRVRARYVIAADGSRSRVREILGVERQDLEFNEQWLNVDTEWLRPPSDKLANTKQFCIPERGHMYMRIGSRRQRFEFALRSDETAQDMSHPARAWELLQDLHGLGPDDVRICRQIIYTFEARIATQWRIGRVFLAGDAAHTMPPYLGQGACGAIRDALNLGWKLDLVMTGRADENLLDTYELERRPHVTAITFGSIELGKIANMPDPQQAAKRDAAMLSGQLPPPPELPPILEGVLQKRANGTASDRAGSLAPQGRVRKDGRVGRFDDVVGHGFVLVARKPVELDRDRQQFITEIGCALVDLTEIEDLDAVHTAYLDALEADAYLARPDFVLFGAASGIDAVPQLIDDLRDALPATPGHVGGAPIAGSAR